jgi:hypothetical protein
MHLVYLSYSQFSILLESPCKCKEKTTMRAYATSPSEDADIELLALLVVDAILPDSSPL